MPHLTVSTALAAVFLSVLSTAPLGAQQAQDEIPLRARCGFVATAPTGAGIDNPDCNFNNTNPSAQYAPTTVLRIPVVVHVMQSNSGAGFLSGNDPRLHFGLGQETVADLVEVVWPSPKPFDSLSSVYTGSPS